MTSTPVPSERKASQDEKKLLETCARIVSSLKVLPSEDNIISLHGRLVEFTRGFEEYRCSNKDHPLPKETREIFREIVRCLKNIEASAGGDIQKELAKNRERACLVTEFDFDCEDILDLIKNLLKTRRDALGWNDDANEDDTDDA
ncbi:MAG: hypothetical protein Satyrvirus15_5 [Satyrvirus sp.]|uniref:Uncharacterized protein n=1 Tax=Satyrvirus sp. TaxID=2487771 RepID=A0A3G5AE54_9VIRU|nr:MAG: hypothetical protein Satyrvirus15_5 [Satyrvirus sp.]